MSESNSQATQLNRRKVLAGLGATASMGLAGCGGDSGNGDDSTGDDSTGGGGERVSNITMEYWSGTSAFESMTPEIKANIEEHLGVGIDVTPVETTTNLRNLLTDARTTALPMYHLPDSPARLSPSTTTVRYVAANAGGNGRPSTNQYTNCEYSARAVAGSKVVEEEDRRTLYNDAHSIMSEDMGVIPISTSAYHTLYRTDQIDPGPLGQSGLAATNPRSITEAEGVGDTDTIRFTGSGITAETTNFWVHNTFAVMGPWNHLFSSSLTERQPDFSIENVLADSIDYEDDGSTVVVSLKESSFHNGDPVTAEDVKWTYDHLLSNPGLFPKGPTIDVLNEIRERDDRTVVFDLEQPYAPLVDREFPIWGILHKDTWVEAGADDAPSEVVLDTFVGSGPYQVDDFQQGQSIAMSPFEDHAVYDPSVRFEYVAYNDTQARFQAVRAGDANVVTINPPQVEQVEGEDWAGIHQPEKYMNYFLSPQHNFGPTKFLEFRQAVGAVLDRQTMTQLYAQGTVDPDLHSCPYAPSHPWRPPADMLYQMTDDPTGDPEAAKQILEDAGWSWDDSGNLRYPEDADLSPHWPQGGTPDPADFECIDEDGNHMQPEGVDAESLLSD